MTSSPFQRLFLKPTEVMVHVGAHKTATTHLQDTLALCANKLLEENVVFLDRESYRDTLRDLKNNRIFTKPCYRNLEKQLAVAKALYSNINSKSRLVISEENLLGEALDLCCVTPYSSPKLALLQFLSQHTKLKLFLSIRSFDEVLPGAYTTGLRFRPEQALAAKNRLLTQLNAGELPTWTSVVKNLQQHLQNVDITVWTTEAYESSNLKIINTLTGCELQSLPLIDRPTSTVRPHLSAVSEVEKMVSASGFKQPKNWTKICDDIYYHHRLETKHNKYSFLDERLINQLKALYQEDLKALSKEEVRLIC